MGDSCIQTALLNYEFMRLKIYKCGSSIFHINKRDDLFIFLKKAELNSCD
jgi:hypothetical protein